MEQTDRRLALAHRYSNPSRVAFLCLVLLVGRADAITVTTTADNGPGSLRQVVMAAASGDSIDFAVDGEITLTSGEILISDDLTIRGPGAEALKVTGGGTRAFEVASGATVVISGLSIAGTVAVGTSGDGGAGGIGGNGGNGGNGGDAGGGAILNDGDLTLRDCTLSGSVNAGRGGNGGTGGDGAGGTPDGGNGGNGGSGGMCQGGVLFNSGTLALFDSSVIPGSCFAGFGGLGNSGGTGSAGPGATGGAGGNGGNGGAGGTVQGGCIYTSGTLEIEDTVLAACSAFGGLGSPGGLGGDGADDDNGGAGGDAGAGGAGGTAQGGAIYSAAGATLTMRNSTLSPASAFGGLGSVGSVGGNGGAGLVADGVGGAGGTGGAGGNGAASAGGGIYAVEQATIVNSTLAAMSAFGGLPAPAGPGGSGGSAASGTGGNGGNGGAGAAGAGGTGGAVFIQGAGSSVMYATITNGSSFASSGGAGGSGGDGGNGDTLGTSGSDGAGGAGGVAGAAGVVGTATISRTILSANGSANCGGGLVSAGFNLSSDTSCVPFFTQPTDLPPNTDAMLADLAVNPPGTTFTRAIPRTSPAFNHIPVASCVEDEDQRGVTRPQGPGCDVGAYEIIVSYQVPALGGLGLFVLAGMLAAAGMLVLRRAPLARRRIF
ncbi:MAG: choice-of-anchor Q domain-containing protein [Candidatus Binatia bacterium]